MTLGRSPGARSLVVVTATAVLVALGAGCSGAGGHFAPPPTATSPRAPSSATSPPVTAPGPSTMTPASRAPASRTPATTRGAPGPEAGPTKLLVVVMENHSLAQMRAQMPYASSLARRYGLATDYRGVRHPSLPNYLAIASGSTHGVTDDAGPAQHALAGDTVFGRALAAGSTAGVYVEGMRRPCEQASEGRYAVKHNPWAYFTAERRQCDQYDLPLEALPAAIAGGSLPAAGMVVPDLCHDAHDCSLAVADAWFRDWMTRIEAGPDWRAGRLVVVLTADEDDRWSGNRVLTVVAHPALDHVVVRTPLDHYSLSRLYAEVTRTAPLGKAAGAASLATAFGLPLPR